MLKKVFIALVCVIQLAVPAVIMSRAGARDEKVLREGTEYTFRLAELDKLFGRRARRRVFEPVTPVHADEKSHLFARRGELRRRSARADLDVVGVRAEEQVSLVLLDPRQRCGKKRASQLIEPMPSPYLSVIHFLF